MFNWFKRRDKAAPPPNRARSRARPTPAPAADADGEPPPSSILPEVVAEGNTPADWSAWEDSVTALDSQLQELAAATRVKVREPRPAQARNEPRRARKAPPLAQRAGALRSAASASYIRSDRLGRVRVEPGLGRCARSVGGAHQSATRMSRRSPLDTRSVVQHVTSFPGMPCSASRSGWILWKRR
jgi:hypothetical protein